MIELAKANKDISDRLERYFQIKIKEAGQVDSIYKKLIVDLSKQVQKNDNKLASFFALLGYQAGSGSDDEAIGQLGLALELYNNAWLAYESAIDLGDHHGKLNIAGLTKKRLDRNHHRVGVERAARAAAILAGNVLSGMSTEVITNLVVNDELTKQLQKNLQRLTSEIAAGAQLEMALSLEPQLDLKKILSVYRHKDALPKVAIPLKMGAILAGCNDKIQDKLEDYGTKCGVAIRLRDDVLGMYAAVKSLGRPNSYDLRQGKRTALMYYGFKFTNVADRKVLAARFGDQNVTTKDLKLVRKILTQSGAKAKVIFLAKQYVDKAKLTIGKIEFPGKVKQQLEAAADHLIS